MENPIRILSDIAGHVTAIVEIDGKEYSVELNSIHLPTAERNKLIRKLAAEQAGEKYER